MLTFNRLRISNFVRNWIEKNQNLLLLRSRLKKEIPKHYLKEFYKSWVFNHLGTRRKQIETATDQLFPLTIKISPTLRCNLKCKGCFAGNYPVENDLALTTLEKIVSQAESMGILSIGIIGGEPLLIPDIFELFKKFSNVGFYLVTNGTLIDAQIVDELQELPHVVTIFSIEGFEETNDFLRGEGVFHKIISAMKKMKEAKLIFGFSTVVHKENLQEVISETYLDFMIENGCFFGGFLPYIPVGSSPRHEVVCNEKEVKNYYLKLNEISKAKPMLILKEGYSDGTFLNQGCGAGQTIHITSNGEAEPCNGIEFFTNNIYASSIKDIFMSEFFQDIRRLHPQNGKRCLTINAPEEILRIVKKHNARATHDQALEHLEEYISLKSRTEFA